MLQIYCDTCRGTLQLEEGQAFAVCQNCGRRIPVPRGYTKEESHFLAAAHARQRHDFEEAAQAYQEILRTDPENTGALWGSAIARFQVEYQEVGERAYRLVCHRAAMSSFMDDPDYKRAVALAPEEEASLYRAEAEKIQSLQERITRKLSSTPPYDVFVDAAPISLQAVRRVARALDEEGYRVFFPGDALEGVPREDWEPDLFCAVGSAGCMVLVADSRDAFTPDVRFDASRFLLRGDVPLYVAFSQLEEYEDIPEEIFDGAAQRLNMDGLNFFDSLLDLLEGRDSSDEYWEETSRTENFEYANLLKSARLELEAGEFEKAKAQFDQVLDFNPQEAQAYWGLLLATHECGAERELEEDATPIDDDPNYISALAFATPREQQIWQQVAENAREQARIRAQLEEDRRRAEEQAERDRQEKEEMIRQAQAQAQLATQKRASRHRVGAITALIVALVLVIGAGGFGIWRWKAGSAGSEAYQLAMNAYNDGNYWSAASQFEALGDYKNSQEMYQSSVQLAARAQYREALENEDRGKAIQSVRSVTDYIPEAQDTLDQWYQEAQDAYDTGDWCTAYELFQGFEVDESSPEMLNMRRRLADLRLVALQPDGGEGYAALGVGPDGTLYTAGNSPDLPGGEYKSVSLGPLGESAGAVRKDGTVVLAGTVAGLVDVSGWTDCMNVMVSNEGAASLRSDGTLLTTFPVDADLTNVHQADYNNGTLILCYNDGTVWCNLSDAREELSSWTDIVWVTASGSQCAGITSSGELLLKGIDYMQFGHTDMLYAFINNGYMAAVTTSGTVHYGSDGGSTASAAAALAVNSAEVLYANEGGAVEFVFRTAGSTGKGDLKKELREWGNVAWPKQ